MTRPGPSSAEVRLQQLQVIADTALSDMEDEDLLGELLERLREILKVDTAVVLLLDASSHQLVAMAARGIEEVHQSVRVPVGTGSPVVWPPNAARCSPGKASVGGDWYDVFRLPSGELGVVMGDVAGQGLRAAVIMGRMRSALRAYALESDDPAEVLDRLDRKMQHFEPGAIATVLHAVCHPELEWARIASAGHWPPVLAAPGLASTLLDLAPDILIGVEEVPNRQMNTVEIPAGAVLCSEPFCDPAGAEPPTTTAKPQIKPCDTIFGIPHPHVRPDRLGARMATPLHRDEVEDPKLTPDRAGRVGLAG